MYLVKPPSQTVFNSVSVFHFLFVSKSLEVEQGRIPADTPYNHRPLVQGGGLHRILP